MWNSHVHSFLVVLCVASACSSNDPGTRLRSTDPRVRVLAVQELGSATDAAATLRTLGPLLTSDPDKWVRAEVAFSIGKLHVREGTALLVVAAAGQDDPTVRVAALTALERNPDPAAIPELIAVWRLERDNNDYMAHVGADHALRAIGKPAVEPLLSVALDTSNRAYVRANALQVLRHLRDSSIRDRLAPLIDDPAPGVSHATKEVLDALDHPPSAN